jgi:DNA/RNA endonuclease YhcR with UshA esterase domain
MIIRPAVLLLSALSVVCVSRANSPCVRCREGQFYKTVNNAIASTAIITGIPTKSKLISIAGARALPPGTVVVIEGTVTVPSGAFKSSTSDEGFAIQDASGAGLYVRMTENLGLRVGERVRATGKLAESNGLLVLVPAGRSSIEARGLGHEVQPQTFSTAKINERTEGRLVKVRGTISRPVGDDPPYGFRFYVKDGTGEIQIYVSASTDINQRGLTAGTRVEVTGLSGQYKDHYEIEPRFPSDIRPTR